jgi:ribulose bisphosphate carboxylase small subunit
MSEKRFQVSEEKCGHLMNLDSSIVQWSITVGKLSVDLDSAKANLAGMYRSRASNLNEQIKLAGIDPSQVLNAKIDPSTGTVVVEVKDSPEAGDPSLNAS